MVRRPVDIIIPVYKGYEVTKACIESVLASENTIETYVYVINDASPEPELNAYLAWLSDNAPVTVLHNTSNLGFPRSVNKGFALNPDHDVILLNSDTLVFSDWADRMARAAYSSHDIGTVTPFSNNATICSYPFTNTNNILPNDISPKDLDDIFKRVNAGAVGDLPTGVGFCMFLRRECLGDVGDFEEEVFGQGYGEENLFCLQAHELGWRSLLAGDVYVPHIGGLSFGKSSNYLLKKNLAILNRHYSSYQESIKSFISIDPLLRLRRAVDEEIIAMRTGTPLIVRICHGFGGGTAKRLRDEACELFDQGYRVATLRPSKSKSKGWANITFEDSPDCPNLTYNLPGEIDAVLDLLRKHNIRKIIIHHFLNLDPCVLDMPHMLSVQHMVVVHDYAWYCPRIKLLDYTGKYCGEPDIDQCQRCVDLDDEEFAEDILVMDLINRSKWIMSRAECVIAPCEDTATRVKKRMNINNVKVVPHEDDTKKYNNKTIHPRNERLKVAVIGGIGTQKGYNIILQCAKDAAVKGQPIEFCIIGETENDCKLFKTGRSIVSGAYKEEKVTNILKKYRASATANLSLWPETWCYTFSIAIKNGFNPVHYNLGSLGERGRKLCPEHCISVDTPIQELNNLILNKTTNKDCRAS